VTRPHRGAMALGYGTLVVVVLALCGAEVSATWPTGAPASMDSACGTKNNLAVGDTVRIEGFPSTGSDGTNDDKKCSWLVQGDGQVSMQINEFATVADTEYSSCSCSYNSDGGCSGEDMLTVYNGQSEDGTVLMQCCGACTQDNMPCMVSTFGSSSTDTTSPQNMLIVFEQPANCYSCGGGDGITFSVFSDDCSVGATAMAANYKAPVGTSEDADTIEDCFDACDKDDTCDLWVFCGKEEGCDQNPYGSCDLKTWAEDLGPPPLWSNCPTGCGFYSGLRCGWKSAGQSANCPPYTG